MLLAAISCMFCEGIDFHRVLLLLMDPDPR